MPPRNDFSSNLDWNIFMRKHNINGIKLDELYEI